MGSVVSTISNIELQASTVGDIFNAGVTIEEEYGEQGNSVFPDSSQP